MNQRNNPPQQKQAAPDFGPQPPPVVRPLTGKIPMRLWMEPRVRLAWISAALILLAAIFIGTTSYMDWHQDYRLINSGLKVNARIEQAAGIFLSNKKVPPDSPVKLSYKVNDREYTVNGFLAGRSEYIVTGTEVPLRVDPENPTTWTYRDTPDPLVHALLGSLIVLPLVIPLTLWALMRKKKLTRAWTHGPAKPAFVLGTKSSALAPTCKRINCTMQDFGDKKVYAAFVPGNVKGINKGDPIWLVVHPEDPKYIAAAMWFE